MESTLTAEDIQKEIAERRARHDALLSDVQTILAERQKERAEFEARSAEKDEAKRPSEDERAEFAAADEKFNESLVRKLAELKELADGIERDETIARSLGIAQRASRGTGGVEGERVSILSEPMTYRRDNQHDFSYFLDLAAMQNQEVRTVPNRKLEGYQERLDRHAKEMADVMPKRWAERKARAEREVEAADEEVRSRHKLRPEVLNESPFTRSEELWMTRRGYDPSAATERLETRAPSRIVGQGGFDLMAAVAA